MPLPLAGHSAFHVALNTFVHSVMYAYYFVMIYDTGNRRKYDFMKKPITELQMVNNIQTSCLRMFFETKCFFFFINYRFNYLY